MGILIGWIVQIVTFPGIIFHELSHKLFCNWFGVQVYEVKYLQLANPMGYVIHAKPDRYYKSFFISVGPLILSTLFACGFFVAGVVLKHFDLIRNVLYWLGISVAAHAFPSQGDGKNLWDATKEEVKINKIAVLGFPVVILIFIANVLHFFWLDIIYGVVLLQLVENLLG